MKIALIASCSLLLASLAARAEEPVKPDALVSVVERDLLAPMAKRDAERSRFSRAWMPPSQRRVRIISASVERDARGLDFVTFAVDTRFGEGEWAKDAIVGCVYPQDGALFVKRGEELRAAAILLGKKAENPPAEVCRAAAKAEVTAAL